MAQVRAQSVFIVKRKQIRVEFSIVAVLCSRLCCKELLFLKSGNYFEKIKKKPRQRTEVFAMCERQRENGKNPPTAKGVDDCQCQD